MTKSDLERYRDKFCTIGVHCDDKGTPVYDQRMIEAFNECLDLLWPAVEATIFYSEPWEYKEDNGKLIDLFRYSGCARSALNVISDKIGTDK